MSSPAAPPPSASFTTYATNWHHQLDHLLAQLTTLSNLPSTPDQTISLHLLIEKILSHYADFYSTRSAACRRDILEIVSSPTASSLERSLDWIFGFRPTILFHLVYSQLSILFEQRNIADVLQGLCSGDGDLADLSPQQLVRLSEMQCETVREENEISEEMAAWQIESAAGVRDLRRLTEVVERADELRRKTMRNVVEILTPLQAGDLLVAMAELQKGIRAWGLNQDLQRHGEGRRC